MTINYTILTYNISPFYFTGNDLNVAYFKVNMINIRQRYKQKIDE